LTCESSNTVIPWYSETYTHGIQIRRFVIKKKDMKKILSIEAVSTRFSSDFSLYNEVEG